jgi:hypothetical protein
MWAEAQKELAELRQKASRTKIHATEKELERLRKVLAHHPIWKHCEVCTPFAISRVDVWD